MYLVVPVNHRVKKKDRKYLNLVRVQKLLWNITVDDSDTNWNWCIWNDLQKPAKKTEGIGNQKMNRDHLDHGILKIN